MSSVRTFQKVTFKLFAYKLYIYIYIQDLALNTLDNPIG